MDVMENLEIWWELNTPFISLPHAATAIHRILCYLLLYFGKIFESQTCVYYGTEGAVSMGGFHTTISLSCNCS